MKISSFELERYFAVNEHHTPFNLCASGLQAFTLEEVFQNNSAAWEGFQKLSLGYVDTQGPESLRVSITKLYNTLEPRHVLAHTGAAEAIFNTCNVLLTPDDHVVIHYPCYASLSNIAKGMGCQVTPWPADPAKEWALSLEHLETLLRHNTKAIILNIPHNPTGYIAPLDFYQDLVHLAQSRGIYVIADEVYRFLEHDSTLTLPAIADLYERGVSIGSMSKAFAMPGLRLGWVATPDLALLEQVALLKDYTSICVNAMGSYIAEVAINQREPIFERNRSILKHNLHITLSFLESNSKRFQWTAPRAGATMFVALKSEEDSREYAQKLLKSQGVLILPGYYYDYGHSYFRLGFGQQNSGEAINRFAYFLKDVELPPRLNVEH